MKSQRLRAMKGQNYYCFQYDDEIKQNVFKNWMLPFVTSLGCKSVDRAHIFSSALHTKCTSVNAFTPQWSYKKRHSILKYKWHTTVHLWREYNWFKCIIVQSITWNDEYTYFGPYISIWSIRERSQPYVYVYGTTIRLWGTIKYSFGYISYSLQTSDVAQRSHTQ